MPTLLRIAWRNSLRNWRRTAIAVTAIAVGLAASMVLTAWGRGMFQQMADSAIRLRLAHLSVHAGGYAQDPDISRSLPDGGRAALVRLATRKGVHPTPRLEGAGLIQSSRNSGRVAVVGVVPRTEAQVSAVPGSMVAGSYLGGTERQRVPPIVIGSAMAERLRVRLGDKVVVHVPGEAAAGAFRVRGLFRVASTEFERSVAFLQLADAQRLFELPGRVTEVAILLDEPDGATALQQWLRAELPDGQEVLRWQEREPALASMLQLMDDIYWVTYAVVFVAMAFGIANVLIMAVYERTRELGVMRSIGLRGRGVVALVLWESLLLTLIGTALGLGIGLGLVLWMAEEGIDLSAFSEGLRSWGIGTIIYPRLILDDLVAPVALAATTALVAGLWPAIRAARMPPARAVRQA